MDWSTNLKSVGMKKCYSERAISIVENLPVFEVRLYPSICRSLILFLDASLLVRTLSCRLGAAITSYKA
jgi:hypothetical protein